MSRGRAAAQTKTVQTSTAQTKTAPTKAARAIRRIRALAASITAIAIVASSCAVWVLFGGIDAAQAGTLGSLEASSGSGAWHTVQSTPLVVKGESHRGGAVLEGFDDVAGVQAGENAPSSWVVQVSAVAADRAAHLTLGSEGGGTVPLMNVDIGDSASVTTLVHTLNGPPVIASDAEVQLRAETIAYFTPLRSNETAPSPGGSAAVPGVAAVDTAIGIGPTIQQFRQGATLSPLGLDALPSEGVEGVWVQAVASGERPELSFTGPSDAGASATSLGSADHDYVTVFDEVGEGTAQGLVPVRLDEIGALRVRVSEGTESVSLSIMGWISSAHWNQDRAVIDAGLMLGGPHEAGVVSGSSGVGFEAPGVVPENALSLFAVSFRAEEGVTLGALDAEIDELGASPTAAEMSGASSAILVAHSESEVLRSAPETIGVTWLGFFVEEAGSEAQAPEITIDTPSEGERINLASDGAQVEFRGTANAADGVVAVHLKKDRRYIGSAEVRLGSDGYSWSYRTFVPTGTHRVTVEAVTASGASRTATRTLHVDQLKSDDVVIAPQVAAVGADLIRQLEQVRPDALVFDSETFLYPGVIVNMAPSALAPEGVLRRVTSAQLVDGRQVLETEPAKVLDMVLNADVRVDDAPLSPDPDVTATPIPVGSALVDEALGELGGASGGSDGAGGSGGPGGAGGTSTVQGASRAAPGPLTPMLDWVDTGSREAAHLAMEASFSAKVQQSEGFKEGSPTKTKVQLSGSAGLQDGPKVSGNWSDSGDISFAVGDWKTQFEKNENEDSQASKKDLGTKVDVSGKSSMSLAAELNIKAKSYLRFELKVSLKTVWGFVPAPQLDIWEMTHVTNEKFEAKVASNATSGMTFTPKRSVIPSIGDQSKQQTEKLRVRLASFPVSVGLLQLWVTLYLVPDLSLSGSIGLDAAFTHKYEVTRERGFRYQHGDLKRIDTTKQNSSSPLTLTLSLTVGVTAKLAFEVKLYETIGAYIGAYGTATYTAKWKMLDLKNEHSDKDDSAETTKDADSETNPITQKVTLEVGGFVGVNISVFQVGLLDSQVTFGKVEIVIWDSEDDVGKSDDEPVTETVSDPNTESRGTDERPLALVIDVSGSMQGDRLERAKASLVSTVNRQNPGSMIGLWTYPDGGCDPGSFKIPMKRHEGNAELREAIEALGADGSTPTGEALIAVADELENAGFLGASVLLVTDGEPNCGVDPLDAAEQVRARGFDLTVSVIAYGDVAADTMQQLADDTGGRHIEMNTDTSSGAGGADDTSAADDELFELIQELSMPVIEASITSPSTLQRGDVQQVEVQLTNMSARDVTAAQFSVVSGGASDITVDPANSLLGNIPVGASVTRTVNVRVDSTADKIDLKLLAWGTNTSVSEATTGFTLHDADDSRLDPKPGGVIVDTQLSERHLLLLGDSSMTFSPEGEFVRSPLIDDCTHGDVVVGEELSEWDQVTNATCAEYTGFHSLQRQLQAIDRTAPEVSSVLMSIGAAETGAMQTLTACIESSCEVGDAAYQNAIWALQELDLTEHLTATWETVNGVGEEAREGGDAAPLLVAAYPLLFPEDRGLQCTSDIGSAQVIAGNLLVAQLNTAIEASVERARALGVEAYYLGDIERSLQGAAHLCGDAPGAQLEATAGGGWALTEGGARNVARSIASWSEQREREPVATVLTEMNAEHWSGFEPTLRVSVDAPAHSYGGDTFIAPTGLAVLTGMVVKPGQRIEVSGAGYAPGSQVFVSLRGDGTAVVGYGVADDEGRAVVAATMPAAAQSGEHSLVVMGVNSQGQSIRASSDVALAANMPFWVVCTLFASGLLLIGAVVFWLLSRRSPRVPSA